MTMRGPHMPFTRTTAPSTCAMSLDDKITQGKVHGEGGAYVGGYWVPLEQCAEKFNIAGGSNEAREQVPCPRSRTRHSAAKPNGDYDVAIIGGGCIGAAIASDVCGPDPGPDHCSCAPMILTRPPPPCVAGAECESAVNSSLRRPHRSCSLKLATTYAKGQPRATAASFMRASMTRRAPSAPSCAGRATRCSAPSTRSCISAISSP